MGRGIIDLDDGEAHAVEFTVEIEGIDVRHAGDVVEHGHEAVVETRGTDLILTRDAVEEQLGVGPVGVHGSFHHLVYEGGHDAETGELDIDDILAVVNMAIADIDALLIGAPRNVRDMLDERSLEASLEDFLFCGDESSYAFAFEGVDDAGAEIDDLLVDVIDVQTREVAMDFVASLRREIGHEELACVGGGEDLEFVGILDVHNFVADVVGCLNEVGERKAYVAKRSGRRRQAKNAQFIGDAQVILAFGIEESEFLMVAGKVAAEGIFDDAGKRAIGHDESAGPTPLEVVGEEAEGVGIAVEMDDVVPLRRREPIAGLGVAIRLQPPTVALAEIRGYGTLAGMPERRIAEVVGEACRADDATHFVEMSVAQLRMTFEQ